MFEFQSLAVRESLHRKCGYCAGRQDTDSDTTGAYQSALYAWLILHMAMHDAPWSKSKSKVSGDLLSQHTKLFILSFFSQNRAVRGVSELS